MQMRPRRASGRAYIGDKLTTRDSVADRGIDLGQVAVTRCQAVAVIDLEHIAIAAGPPGLDDRAVRRGDNKVAAFAVDIHSRVKLIRASAKRIAPKAKFVVDLAKMGPHR